MNIEPIYNPSLRIELNAIEAVQLYRIALEWKHTEREKSDQVLEEFVNDFVSKLKLYVSY